KARLQASRRRAREVLAQVEPAIVDPPELQRRELAAVLEEELGLLPERYRRAVVLCYIEGLTNEEAARRLACPKGTILSRLSRARDRLRDRLRRRGIDMPHAALPALAAVEPAPQALVDPVAAAGPLLRAGGETALSAPVMKLAKGVVFGMLARKLTVIGLVV